MSSEKTRCFYNQVYDIVRLIPKGRVTTYGAIARALGTGRSARLVGTAMNHSHGPELKVPAHRVVNSQGLLTGKHHFSTDTEMEEMLLAEGITVVDDQVQNFIQIFWDPMTEL